MEHYPLQEAPFRRWYLLLKNVLLLIFSGLYKSFTVSVHLSWGRQFWSALGINTIYITIVLGGTTLTGELAYIYLSSLRFKSFCILDWHVLKMCTDSIFSMRTNDAVQFKHYIVILTIYCNSLLLPPSIFLQYLQHKIFLLSSFQESVIEELSISVRDSLILFKP